MELNEKVESKSSRILQLEQERDVLQATQSQVICYSETVKWNC